MCASNRHATIDSLLLQYASGSRSYWNITFVCNFNDWELEGVVSFFEFLHSHFSFKVGADGLHWRLKGNGVFEIRLRIERLSTSDFPLESHLVVFMFRGGLLSLLGLRLGAAWGRILTADNLMRRGYQLAGWCYMCRCEG